MGTPRVAKEKDQITGPPWKVMKEAAASPACLTGLGFGKEDKEMVQRPPKEEGPGKLIELTGETAIDARQLGKLCKKTKMTYKVSPQKKQDTSAFSNSKAFQKKESR